MKRLERGADARRRSRSSPRPREKFRSIIPEPFSNWPANYRATQISDGNTECSFLDLFGRPPRDTPLRSRAQQRRRRSKQALYFLNSEQLEGKITGSPRLKRLLAHKPDAEVVEELYLTSAFALSDRGREAEAAGLPGRQESCPRPGRAGRRVGRAQHQGIRVQPLSSWR